MSDKKVIFRVELHEQRWDFHEDGEGTLLTMPPNKVGHKWERYCEYRWKWDHVGRGVEAHLYVNYVPDQIKLSQKEWQRLANDAYSSWLACAMLGPRGDLQ